MVTSRPVSSSTPKKPSDLSPKRTNVRDEAQSLLKSIFDKLVTPIFLQVQRTNTSVGFFASLFAPFRQKSDAKNEGKSSKTANEKPAIIIQPDITDTKDSIKDSIEDALSQLSESERNDKNSFETMKNITLLLAELYAEIKDAKEIHESMNGKLSVITQGLSATTPTSVTLNKLTESMKQIEETLKQCIIDQRSLTEKNRNIEKKQAEDKAEEDKQNHQKEYESFIAKKKKDETEVAQKNAHEFVIAKFSKRFQEIAEMIGRVQSQLDSHQQELPEQKNVGEIKALEQNANEEFETVGKQILQVQKEFKEECKKLLNHDLDEKWQKQCDFTVISANKAAYVLANKKLQQFLIKAASLRMKFLEEMLIDESKTKELLAMQLGKMKTDSDLQLKKVEQEKEQVEQSLQKLKEELEQEQKKQLQASQSDSVSAVVATAKSASGPSHKVSIGLMVTGFLAVTAAAIAAIFTGGLALIITLAVGGVVFLCGAAKYKMENHDWKMGLGSPPASPVLTDDRRGGNSPSSTNHLSRKLSIDIPPQNASIISLTEMNQKKVESPKRKKDDDYANLDNVKVDERVSPSSKLSRK